MENLILRRVAALSGKSIEFKDENILPGTAWIGALPIDIQIEDGVVVLNAVGKFSGDSKGLSKGVFRGKGMFRELVPHIKQALGEYDLATELYVFPLSPVWAKNYNFVKCETAVKGCFYKIVM